MKLSEFIKQLQRIEASGKGNCPVCLADWYYDRLLPNESYAERARYIENSNYVDNQDKYENGSFVLIGD